MNKNKGLLLIVLLSLLTAFKEKDEWTPLLDKDLSGWETYLSYRHVPGYKGEMPRNPSGTPVTPVGYNKNEQGVFSVIDEAGEPVLRVSGEIYGSVFTKREYQNYHLKLKV